MVGRDSSVGIATWYGLDGLSLEGVKWPGHAIDHPPPYSAEVKERVELYLYSISGPSRPVPGPTLPVPLLFTVIWILWV
jgi:hypothetical protein